MLLLKTDFLHHSNLVFDLRSETNNAKNLKWLFS